jgi:exodeoxyribonuclease-5
MAQDELSALSGIDDADYYDSLAVPTTDLPLTDDQEAALETIIDLIDSGETEISLSGAAGTGKTTMIHALVDALSYCAVAVCTPTNKAAMVLKSKGLSEASTIHRRFFVPVAKSKPLRFISGRLWLAAGNPLPPGKLAHADVIIVDEASMLGSKILDELRQMCDILILVGDGNQLPPVADSTHPEGYFNSRKHDATLTKVLRQGEGSSILSLATDVREGRAFVNTIKQFYPEESFSDLAAHPDIKFIAFTNKERSRLNRLLRLRKGLKDALPQLGETMICASNYSDLLLNGTEGVLEAWNWDGSSRIADVWLRLPGRELEPAKVDMLYFFSDLQQLQRRPYDELCAKWQRARILNDDKEDDLLALRYGYCITAHAAQGSEFDEVCVIDQLDTINFVNEKDRAEGGRGMTGKEAVRRWLYTAVTRAKKNLYIAPVWYAGSVIEGGGNGG